MQTQVKSLHTRNKNIFILCLFIAVWPSFCCLDLQSDLYFSHLKAEYSNYSRITCNRLLTIKVQMLNAHYYFFKEKFTPCQTRLRNLDIWCPWFKWHTNQRPFDAHKKSTNLNAWHAPGSNDKCTLYCLVR
jgi:hypothetical protein